MTSLPELTAKQKLMIEYGAKHPYSILAADPRLGKSRAAIALRSQRRANCLIVCPAYLISNWRKEILKWQPDASVTVFKAGKDIYDVVCPDFVVTSYDLVQKAEHLFEWADMVVADEVHNLKSMSAKRTQFFHRAVFENSIKYFHGLTGTPIKNRVKEFYSLLSLANYDPAQADTSFLVEYPDEITFAEQFSFSETYEVPVSKGNRSWTMPVTNYTGIRNQEELKEWLKGKYIRIRAGKEDLPPLSYLDTLVSDIDDQKLLAAFAQHFVSDEAVKKSVRALAEQGVKMKDSEIRRMRTSSALPEHKKEAALRKVPFTIKYVEDLIQTVPCCLIYSDHKEPIQAIAEHFKVPAITGEMPGARRSQLVNDFQSGKLHILCATIGSLKEGADLFRAKDLVLSDAAWVPGDLVQVMNRMRALGEKEPRTVHRILGSPQDQHIWQVLEEKIRTIEAAT